jgi:BTB/POZ domain
MAADIFVTKGKFDDLEIQTSDADKKLYVAKGWLIHVSPYFNAMLTNGLSESKSDSITLEHTFDIILTIFQCIYSSCYFCEEHVKQKLLSKVEDICEFLVTIQEYQLDSLKNICDRYYASHPDVVSFFKTDIINIICLTNMEQTKQTFRELIKKDINIINNLKFENMTSDIFKLCCVTWESLCFTFTVWLKHCNPTDDELKKFKLFTYNYHQLTKYYAKSVMRVLRTLKNAPEFKLMVYDKLSLIIAP